MVDHTMREWCVVICYDLCVMIYVFIVDWQFALSHAIPGIQRSC